MWVPMLILAGCAGREPGEPLVVHGPDGALSPDVRGAMVDAQAAVERASGGVPVGFSQVRVMSLPGDLAVMVGDLWLVDPDLADPVHGLTRAVCTRLYAGAGQRALAGDAHWSRADFVAACADGLGGAPVLAQRRRACGDAALEEGDLSLLNDIFPGLDGASEWSLERAEDVDLPVAPDGDDGGRSTLVSLGGGGVAVLRVRDAGEGRVTRVDGDGVVGGTHPVPPGPALLFGGRDAAAVWQHGVVRGLDAPGAGAALTVAGPAGAVISGELWTPGAGGLRRTALDGSGETVIPLPAGAAGPVGALLPDGADGLVVADAAGTLWASSGADLGSDWRAIGSVGGAALVGLLPGGGALVSAGGLLGRAPGAGGDTEWTADLCVPGEAPPMVVGGGRVWRLAGGAGTVLESWDVGG